MYARLDDELLDHEKMFLAGRAIGKNGCAIACGFYAFALMWCNRQLSNGILPIEVIQDNFRRFVINPTAVADALVAAGLFDKHARGYLVHDYTDHNPSAASVKAHRKRERDRKRAQREVKRGNGAA